MTELKIKELEKKVTGSDGVIVDEARSVEALSDHVVENVRNVLILRKAKAAYEFPESKKKFNHLLFMVDLKLYSQSENVLDLLVQTVPGFSEDIGMEFGIKKCAMLVMEKGMWNQLV